MSVVFKAVRWSLEALLDRRWPARDWNGVLIDYSNRLGQARSLFLVLIFFCLRVWVLARKCCCIYLLCLLKVCLLCLLVFSGFVFYGSYRKL